METTRTTVPDQRLGDSVVDASRSEWNAVDLRPVAHWVLMPSAGGRRQLSMVWEVPDPLPPSLRA
jgi:hypothetical protein